MEKKYKKNIMQGLKIIYFTVLPLCLNVVIFTQQPVFIKVICGLLSVLIFLAMLAVPYLLFVRNGKRKLTFLQFAKEVGAQK